MQQPPNYATSRRVGCLTWLVAVTLVLTVIGLFLDITQELAWNRRMDELNALADRLAVAPIAEVQAVEVSPTDAPPNVIINGVAATDIPPTNPPPTIAPPPPGVTYEQICDVDENNMTDPQLEAHAARSANQTFSGWQGWVYDVVSQSDDTYDLQIAMNERNPFWGRDIVVENIPTDLAVRLNVEQALVFDGRVAQVDYTFEIMCNPMIVDNFVLK